MLGRPCGRAAVAAAVRNRAIGARGWWGQVRWQGTGGDGQKAGAKSAGEPHSEHVGPSDTPRPPSLSRRERLQARYDERKGQWQERREERKEEVQDEREKLAEMTIYQKLKHYGPVAMALYLTIHTIGFWLCFFLIYTGVPIKKYLAQWLGEDNLPSYAKGPWAEFAVALTVNKLFGPLQMLLTVTITPRVAPIVLSSGPGRALVSFIARFMPKKKGTPPITPPPSA
eukprot:TRINITY_DN1817_c0_g4_i2.p1 TRINITY_DN1817_c0_g4~~TRINITY_DN1817_c0_g4_i2.p1  ORF type:complete len:227 (+),score=49.54 TRINITY_DN1817_c0_g4_i2:881-1561(+)